MRSKFIIITCVATLLIAGYTVHQVRDSRYRHKLGIPASASIRDFGAVEFASGVPMSFQLGSGKDLTITATTVTNDALLATVPATFTNGVLQLSLSYTSKTEVASGRTQEFYTEHQTFMYPQKGHLAITFASETRNPMAAVMSPSLLQK
jgi:hypothetical protein